MNKLKRAAKSRTIIFGTIISILALFQGMYMQIPMSVEMQTAVGLIVGSAIIILRVLTTTSLGDEEEGEQDKADPANGTDK
jgi:hypothetical protein